MSKGVGDVLQAAGDQRRGKITRRGRQDGGDQLGMGGGVALAETTVDLTAANFKPADRIWLSGRRRSAFCPRASCCARAHDQHPHRAECQAVALVEALDAYGRRR
jgi:hypothetical protein